MQRCHNNRQVPSKKYLLALIIPALMSQQAFAEEANEPSVDLGTEYITIKKPTPKIATKTISDKQISRQMVADNRDLVRYETGISVVEAGRFGTSGYAIRGVDENRVAITVDGLHQAETLSSQGFKELFEGYGNFNNTRNSVEMENIKTATINKGADSIKTGTGTLGGAVMFDTKEANDYLAEKDYFASIKRGYQSANNQNVTSATLAGKYKWFDALIVHTDRHGHETENYGYKHYDSEAVGRTREKTDPYTIDRKSTLLKLGFQPSSNYRFGVAIDNSRLESRGADLSYSLRQHSRTDTERYGERLNHDKSKRKNLQFSHENFIQTPIWDHVKITFSSQKITNTARTDEYCFKPNCVQVENNQGLRLDDSDGVYKVVDKNGGAITGGSTESGWSTSSQYTNSQGEILSGTDYKELPVESTLIDCDKLDCSKKYRVFIKQNENYDDIYQFEDRQIQIGTLADGKRYGYIEPKSIANSWGGVQQEELVYLFPFSRGYSRNDYNDRDLNTDTKQLNLDLDKFFSLFKTDHNVKYGAVYSKTDKSMINKDGYEGGNVQWWADNFFCNEPIDGTYPIERTPSPNKWPIGACTGAYRSQTGNQFSYLVPVTSKNHAFYFTDNIRITDKIGLDLGYRYDKIKHSPSYDENVPVPKGLIAGIFVPFPAGAVAYGTGANCGYNTDCMNQNFAQNLEILLQKTNYKHHSYNIGMAIDPTNWLRVQTKYSNGFRAPTSDEMYMTFKHPSFSIAPNTNLKAEIGKTKEAAVTLHRDGNYLTLSAFRTDYKNFIDLVYMGERAIDTGSALTYPFYQNQNRDNAKVTGFEMASRLSLANITDRLDGFNFDYKYTRQKGRMEGNLAMNAIQPHTMVFGLGYDHPNDKFGANLYLTHASAKKAEDTYNIYANPNDNDKFIKWRSGAYNIVDFTAYIRPIKNLTVQAGVYNLFDKKYLTWDSARSIRSFGTNNLINQETGAGIARFYAPERNFKVAVEYKF